MFPLSFRKSMPNEGDTSVVDRGTCIVGCLSVTSSLPSPSTAWTTKAYISQNPWRLEVRHVVYVLLTGCASTSGGGSDQCEITPMTGGWNFLTRKVVKVTSDSEAAVCSHAYNLRSPLADQCQGTAAVVVMSPWGGCMVGLFLGLGRWQSHLVLHPCYKFWEPSNILQQVSFCFNCPARILLFAYRKLYMETCSRNCGNRGSCFFFCLKWMKWFHRIDGGWAETLRMSGVYEWTEVERDFTESLKWVSSCKLFIHLFNIYECILCSRYHARFYAYDSKITRIPAHRMFTYFQIVHVGNL